ncbi:MAG: aminopeptidase P N-terminal domain-containing protein [Rhodocyclaceae bacterium]
MPRSPEASTLAAIARRRQQLAERLRAVGGGVAIVPTAPERIRNRDAHYAFRADSYFHYLTGFNEPEAVLVLLVGSGDNTEMRSVLFCRSKNEEREIWDGFRYGPAAAAEVFGFDEAHAIDDFAGKLPELIGNQPALWYALGYDAHHDTRVLEALNTVRMQGRSGVIAPSDIRDIRGPLDEMRLIKDAVEIDTMRQAARISGEAHRRAMRFTRPGVNEYEVEAELLHEFRRQGSQSVAYNSIVAGGANACVLHYVSNDAPLHDGDLLLIDAGCELDGYASDITRTFPVNGRFSAAQRDVYELVLAAQQAAFAQARPGNTYDTTHDAAVKVLAQGMLDLGLLSGSLDSVLETGAYRRFYMHRTGHWLGLDVHDAGEYKLNGQWRPLQPGMVITVEPGCYIRPAPDVPEAFWNIGIRVEDDVLITDDGYDILTHDTPRSVSDIELIMSDVDERG